MSIPPSSPKALRSDGLEARTRLLDAALVLFAEKGFAKTSTREIALAAKVNVASISYYFGDKAGLYRAVYQDPRSNPEIDPASIDHPDLGLEESLKALLGAFLEPLKHNMDLQNCMKLQCREMLEPTGLWEEELEGSIKPVHNALLNALCRALGLARADEGVQRLAFSISGLGIMLHVGLGVIEALHPALVATPQAMAAYQAHLLQAALSMVEGEARARGLVLKLHPLSPVVLPL